MLLEVTSFSDSSNTLLGSRQTSNFYKQYCDKKTKRHCDYKIKRHFSSNIFLHHVNWKSRFIFISADFERQKQSFVKKILLWSKKIVALSQYRFFAISKYCLQKLLVWRGPIRHSLSQCFPTLSPFATCGDRRLLKNEFLMINKLHISLILAKVATEKPSSPQFWRMWRQREFGWTPLIYLYNFRKFAINRRKSAIKVSRMIWMALNKILFLGENWACALWYFLWIL